MSDDMILHKLQGRKACAIRYGADPAVLASIEREMTMIQVRRDLGRLASKAAVLPAEDRTELSQFIMSELTAA
jgi:hypothetical protein